MDEIKVSVEDNGIGIENVEAILKNKAMLKKQNSGVGISNINKRLMKYYETELHFNSEINKGTQVYFTLKI